MMFNLPYWGMPYYRRYPRYSYYNYPSNDYPIPAEPQHSNQNINSKDNNVDNSVNEKKENRSLDEDSPIFEIFGIKLFFDDILLICLLFFLYSEGVQDQWLFITLILLLLS